MVKYVFRFQTRDDDENPVEDCLVVDSNSGLKEEEIANHWRQLEAEHKVWFSRIGLLIVGPCLDSGIFPDEF